MTQMKDIRDKSEKDLIELIETNRKAVREERFKDRFNKKAGAIRGAKKVVARALTELNARRNQKAN